MNRSAVCVTLLFLISIRCQNKPDDKNASTSPSRNLDNYIPGVQCNSILLTSLDLVPLKVPTTQKNFMCNGIVKNCCTYESQFRIYKRWTHGGEGPQLSKFYKRYLLTYQRILKSFATIESIATNIKNGVPEGSTSNCGMLANRVLGVAASAKAKDILGLFRRAFRYLYDSRRGFYCAVCDSENLHGFSTKNGLINSSNGFCSSLVKETMAAMSFKFQYFQKITRLYSQLVVSCDAEGAYSTEKVPRENIIFTSRRHSKTVEECKDGLTKLDPLEECSNYCSHFNPAKLSLFFEGQFKQTSRYQKWIKLQIEKFSPNPNQQSADKGDLNFAGRLLEEKKHTKLNGKNRERKLQGGSNTTPDTPPATPTTPDTPPATPTTPDTPPATPTTPNTTPRKPKVDDFVNGIQAFNNEYGTQLIVPLTFKPQQVFGDKSRSKFLRSLFKLSKHPLVSPADFTTVSDKFGTNWIRYAYNSLINDDSFAALSLVYFTSKSGQPAGSNTTASSTTTPAPTQTAQKPASRLIRRK